MTQEEQESLPLVVGDVIHQWDDVQGFCSHLVLAVEEKFLITFVHDEETHSDGVEVWYRGKDNWIRLPWLNNRWCFL